VALRTDVSEERKAFISRVTRIDELGITSAVSHSVSSQRASVHSYN
jgi:hypothetical protein